MATAKSPNALLHEEQGDARRQARFVRAMTKTNEKRESRAGGQKNASKGFKYVETHEVG
jgi:hypothetical protein